MVFFKKILNTRTLIILWGECHQVGWPKMSSLWRSGKNCSSWYTMFFL